MLTFLHESREFSNLSTFTSGAPEASDGDVPIDVRLLKDYAAILHIWVLHLPLQLLTDQHLKHIADPSAFDLRATIKLPENSHRAAGPSAVIAHCVCSAHYDCHRGRSQIERNGLDCTFGGAHNHLIIRTSRTISVASLLAGKNQHKANWMCSSKKLDQL